MCYNISMKRSELFFNIASIPVDVISLVLAGLFSYFIRLRLGSYFPIAFVPDFKSYFTLTLESIPLLLLFFALSSLYNLKGTRKFSREITRIVGATSLALLTVIVIFFFDQNIFPSRLAVLVAWILSIIFVIAGRYVLKVIQVFLLNRGLGLHRLAIIVNDGSEVPVVQYIIKDKELGYKVVAQIKDENSGDTEELLSRLDEIYKNEHIEEILQANPNASEQTNLSLVEYARNKGLVFNFVPNLFNVQRNIVETETIKGIPVISLRNTPLDGWGKVVKRVFDIIVALVCIILTSPFFIIISALIKLDSKGKVLYAAPRGGNNKDFTFYKFRTMYNHLSIGEGYGGEEAEKLRQELWKVNARGGENGPFLKIKNDPRVTRVGRILRKTKLDELPQFFNVLKGDMSMVGPRAHVIDEVERYRDRYHRMFTIKPGIFGLSQIAQLSWPDLPFGEEIRLNTYYIENWSIWLDISILAKSFIYLFINNKKEDY